MIGAYKQGKDLYATIASGVYRNGYWDNMEHYEDGTPNPAGKKRRSSVKSLLLGIMYGRGVASIAEQIGGTIQEAQKIVDDFYAGFPKVKKWIDETYVNAKSYGYVEDMWGRRRRLTDIQLPKYEVFYKDETSNPTDFNPILGALNIVKREVNPKITKYEKLLCEAKDRKSVETIKENAKKEGVTINDNGGFISRAERQCVNARVQGGAATMSKKAMIKVHHDEELKNLGFRLMLAVHDELIGECPEENADKVADRLCELMKSAALPECVTPFKCDPTIESVWYETDYSDNLLQSYEKLCKTMTSDEALQQLYITNSECTEERIHKFLQI